MAAAAAAGLDINVESNCSSRFGLRNDDHVVVAAELKFVSVDGFALDAVRDRLRV